MRGLCLTFVTAFLATSLCCVVVVRAEAPLLDLELDLKPPVGPIDYTYANYQNYEYDENSANQNQNTQPEPGNPGNDGDSQTVEVPQPQPQPTSKPVEILVPTRRPIFQGVPHQDQIVYQTAASDDRIHTLFYQSPEVTYHRVDTYQGYAPYVIIRRPVVQYGPPKTTTTTTTTTTPKPVPIYGPPSTTQHPPTYGPPTVPDSEYGPPSKVVTPPKPPTPEYGPPKQNPRPTYIPPVKPTPRPKPPSTTPYREYGPPKWTTTTKKPVKGYVYATPAPEQPRLTYGPPSYGKRSLPSYRLDPNRLRLGSSRATQ